MRKIGWTAAIGSLMLVGCPAPVDQSVGVVHHDGVEHPEPLTAVVEAPASATAVVSPDLLEAWVRISIKLRLLQTAYAPRLAAAAAAGDTTTATRLKAEAESAAATFLAGEPWAAADLARVSQAIERDPRLAAEAERIARRLTRELGLQARPAVEAPPAAEAPSPSTTGAAETMAPPATAVVP